MGSFTPEIRKRIVKAYKKGYRIEDIAAIFGVSRWVIWKWRKRVLDYTTSIGTGGFVTDSQCGFRTFNTGDHP